MAIKRRSVLAGGAALFASGGVSAPAILRAQSSSKVNVGHGMAMHGQPKYAADAVTPDYINAKAPKGGNVRLGTQGTYDSLHPFILKGVAAAGIGTLWETLCWHARDEAFTVYGMIAETLEWPDDRSWVAFTLRPQAKWHDGAPI
ncbi:MAG TPA: ABC transporter substrate-binding protein, partial [Reyranella sp.]